MTLLHRTDIWLKRLQQALQQRPRNSDNTIDTISLHSNVFSITKTAFYFRLVYGWRNLTAPINHYHQYQCLVNKCFVLNHQTQICVCSTRSPRSINISVHCFLVFLTMQWVHFSEFLKNNQTKFRWQHMQMVGFISLHIGA